LRPIRAAKARWQVEYSNASFAEFILRRQLRLASEYFNRIDWKRMYSP
jgi:hypothetical protein